MTNKPGTVVITRDKIRDVKQFVKRHKTCVACAITAAATYKLTRTHMTDVITNYVYNLGREAGVRDVQLTVLYEFVNANELQDELDTFISLLK